jgi:hypothetical protein
MTLSKKLKKALLVAILVVVGVLAVSENISARESKSALCPSTWCSWGPVCTYAPGTYCVLGPTACLGYEWCEFN